MNNLSIGQDGSFLGTDGTLPIWTNDMKRLNLKMKNVTISTEYNIAIDDEQIIKFVASSGNRKIKLPDGTTLSNGWTIHIINDDSSTINMQLCDGSGTEIYTVSNHTILTLIDNTTVAGKWEFQLTQEHNRIVVAKAGTDYSSINDALSSITDASESNPYVIMLAPGEYTEDPITLVPYINIIGFGPTVSKILATNTTDTVITASSNCFISQLTVKNASGVSGIGILCENVINFNMINCSIENCETGTKAISTTVVIPTVVVMIICKFTLFKDAILVDGSVGVSQNVIQVLTRGCNFVNSHIVSMENGIKIIGPYANYIGNADHFLGNSFNPARVANAVIQYDGSKIKLFSPTIGYFHTGICVDNQGSDPELWTSNVVIHDCTCDITINHPNTDGIITGIFDRSKIHVDNSSDISMNYVDPINSATTIIGSIIYGKKNSDAIDISEAITGSTNLGLYDGGLVTKNQSNSLTIDITAGNGYVSTHMHELIRVEWNAESKLLTTDNVCYIYYDNTSTFQAALSKPSTHMNIILACVKTNDIMIEFIDYSYGNVNHQTNKFDQFNRDVIKNMFINGCIVSANASRELSITAGVYYTGANKASPSGGSSVTFIEYYHSSSSWTTNNTQTVVNNTQYDNGTNLVSLTTDYYTKHSLYLLGEGSNEIYFLVIGSVEYDTLVGAQNSPLVLPPSHFAEGIVIIGSIIVQEGSTSIIEFSDERPQLNKGSSSTAQTTLHGDLQGLGNDDHPQYLMADGSRNLVGNLNLNNNNLMNVNLINSINIGSHQSRHLPNGSDPLTTAAPSTTITTSTTNLEGIANSFARSDHSHAFDQSTVDHTQIQNIGTYSHTQIDSHIDSTANPHTVTKTQIGLSDVPNLKMNLSATSAPTVNDDTTSNYSIGSMWINTTSEISYICTDPTTSSAQWSIINQVGEINTASNIGTGGIGLFKQKSGFDLEFKNFNNLSSGAGLNLVDNTTDNQIDIQLDQSEISHTNLSNIGSNTHAQIDTHIDDSSLHFTEASIDHTNISSIGTYSHSQIDTHIDSSSNPHSVTKAQIGLSNIENIKNNLSAIIAPTTDDDLSAGYVVGSQWINISTDKAYICLDSTNSASIWKESTMIDTGETNTMSNIGTGGGFNVFKTKNGVNFEMKGLNKIGTILSLTENGTTNEIEIGLNEGVIDHQNITGAGVKTHTEIDSHINDATLHFTEMSIDHTAILNVGTYTHSQIDTHIDSTSNPHSVTKTQLGLSEVPNLKVNLSAIIDPTVNNDSTESYGAGSRWLNTVTNKEYVCLDPATAGAIWRETTVDQVGEVNTASNVGNAGIGIFNGKTVLDLEFKKINAASSKITLTDDVANEKIDIDIDVGQLDHTAIQNIGTYTHTQLDAHLDDSTIHFTKASIDHVNIQNIGTYTHIQIDSHIDSTSNPHTVTKSQLGLSLVENTKHNWTANIPPTTSDDTTQGYQKGSRWINQNTNIEYVCMDETTATAVWVATTVDTGEVNTVSNIGLLANGLGLYKEKIGTDLTFKRIHSLSSYISLVDDTGNSRITVDFNPNLITHTDLTDIGTNTHSQIDTHLASSANPHSITKSQIGLSLVENIKNNLSATTSPTTSDDTNSGYQVGSRWIDVTNDKDYVCVDHTVLAAVWKDTTYVDTVSGINLSGTGLGIFKQKNGNNLEFKRLLAGNNIVSLADISDEINISINVGNIDHTALQNIGTYTHAQLDAPLDSTAKTG